MYDIRSVLGLVCVTVATLSACSSETTPADSATADVVEQTDAAGSSDATGADALVLNCVPTPSDAALVKVGTQNGVRILPGGRALTPAGTEAVVGGFPIDVRYHPNLNIAYIANTGYRNRSVQVVEASTGKILQQVDREETFYGIALSEDGTRLYASGGFAGKVEIYNVAPDGKLSGAAQVPVDSYPAGIALAKDGSKFWVGQFHGNAVQEFDAKTLALLRIIKVPVQPYALLHLPGRNELWVASLSNENLVAIDLSGDATAQTKLEVGMTAVNLVATPDEGLIYAASANADHVVAIDVKGRMIIGTQPVGEPGILGEDNKPLPASSPGGLAYDAKSKRLYVARAADNAVSVLNGEDLAPLGALPVSWYPTAVALSPDGSHLMVLNGKGVGSGPLPSYQDGSEGGKELMKGSVSIIDLTTTDLAKATAQVEANVRRPSQVFPFQCDGSFPVPAQRGGVSPIQHIVLIVKENKTYDSVFGDLEQGERDPKLTMWGEKVTPNLHALARKYAHHDNFYDDSETSIQGHLWLTSSFVDDYMERTWFEDYRNHPGWGEDAVHPSGRPAFKTFFTHLMRHNIDFTMFGEIVGALDAIPEGTVAEHVDGQFPGSFFNTDISDVTKAKYVADVLVNQGKFPPFVYVLLPNDHTHGLGAGSLTPEAMINDNDVGMGVLVDAISHSKYFDSTAIFIVEDDPQMGADHVDYHRSICLVVSPYAKPGYVSHVHTSYPSLFRSFELILNLPPLNRYDALATPMWDVFQQEKVAEITPYVHVERTIPDLKNGGKTLGARISAHMDFSGPDKNPDLGDLLAWHTTGVARPGSRIDRIVRGELPMTVLDEPETEDEDDDVYDAAMTAMRKYIAVHPEFKNDMRAKKRRARDVD